MNELRQWVLCLIIAAVAGTFVMVISPRGSMDKTVRAVVGIFVVAAICAPVAQLKDKQISVEALADFEFSQAPAADKELKDYMLSSLKNAVDSQVRKASEEIGITTEKIFAEMKYNAENCIIIHSITVEIPEKFAKKSSELSEILEERLGVPVAVNAE